MNIAFRVLQLNSGKTYSRKLLLGRGKFFCVLDQKIKSKPLATTLLEGSHWLRLPCFQNAKKLPSTQEKFSRVCLTTIQLENAKGDIHKEEFRLIYVLSTR